MLKAVCFDMDGVLFDTEQLNFATLALSAGLPENAFAEWQWRRLLGANMDDTLRLMSEWFPGRIDKAQIIRAWPDITLDYVRQRGVPCMPGAKEALDMLRVRGFKISICTSNEQMIAREYVRLSGWTQYFDHIVSADMVPNGKPAPDIYLKAAELMGVSPAECLGVEDSPMGLRAIRAAGMTSVMVPDSIPYSDDLAPVVDHLLSSLTGLPAVLSVYGA